MEIEMTWYSARLLFESVITGAEEDRDPLCEISIRVLRASSEEGARARARQLGAQQRESYENSDKERVHWVFREVLEVQDLCEESLEDGTEVFSRLVRASRLRDDVPAED